MGSFARELDVDEQIRDQQEQQRAKRIKPIRHCETKTFIVGGDITAGLYIPPVYLRFNVDDESPEWKRIVLFDGILRTGAITVNWELDGTVILNGMEIDTAGSTFGVLDNPIDVTYGAHWLRVVPVDGEGEDLSAAYAATTGR